MYNYLFILCVYLFIFIFIVIHNVLIFRFIFIVIFTLICIFRFYVFLSDLKPPSHIGTGGTCLIYIYIYTLNQIVELYHMFTCLFNYFTSSGYCHKVVYYDYTEPSLP